MSKSSTTLLKVDHYIIVIDRLYILVLPSRYVLSFQGVSPDLNEHYQLFVLCDERDPFSPMD